MILKASQRSGAAQLGQHLLKTEENEHVEVHEVRGFMSENVMGAMKEAQAMARSSNQDAGFRYSGLKPLLGETHSCCLSG